MGYGQKFADAVKCVVIHFVRRRSGRVHENGRGLVLGV